MSDPPNRFPAASVLFDRREDREAALAASPPDCFLDLHLDQIVDAIIKDREGYDLRPFFSWPARTLETIRYRHEVFSDLSDNATRDAVRRFSAAMREVRSYLTLVKKLSDRFHKEGWLLQTIQKYCDAVSTLARDFSQAPLKARGLTALRDYLAAYVRKADFGTLHDEAEILLRQLSDITYSIRIYGDSFTVDHLDGEPDYSAEIEATFAKFQQGAVNDYKVKYRSAPQDMNHIEAKILEFVARLNPELFSRLLDYARRHTDFIDDTIAVFEHDIQFYLACIDHMASFTKTGLASCLPDVSGRSKDISVTDGFDLSLAAKNIPIVCNDFALSGPERIIVVSGPNQGGKTTFARMFGQLHYLAALGCPVPARSARLFLFDTIFTHFEKEEKVENLRGKLEDDLVRIHAILQAATDRSVIVLNEIFTSTTIQDEVFLSRNVMEIMRRRDVVGVWVTFVDELASAGPQTVSMVSTIVPENPAQRTFKIVRRPADGLAYAMAIAEKYRLTHDRILERIAS
jgi:hypothetical protein